MNRVSAKQILSVIPDEMLSQLSVSTKVGYYTKVLYGRHMFYLLLFALIKVDRLSQRELADIFSSPIFRTLFYIEGERELSHSSISDRLSTMSLDFFRLAYEHIYTLLSSIYSTSEIEGIRLQRIDSHLAADASNRLVEGLFCGSSDECQRHTDNNVYDTNSSHAGYDI